MWLNYLNQVLTTFQSVSILKLVLEVESLKIQDKLSYAYPAIAYHQLVPILTTSGNMLADKRISVRDMTLFLENFQLYRSCLFRDPEHNF